MVDWPDTLVRDIARRRCVIVVGAGVSRQSRGANGELPPTWRGFLEDCNNAAKGGPYIHIKHAIDQGDLLHACEWLQRIYDSDWVPTLRTAFSHPKYAVSKSHLDICRLDTRVIFTLNFDDIIDRAAQDIYSGTCVKKTYYDDDVAEFLRGSERYLVKVHGTLDNPSNLIFTQNQYSSARVRNSSFYNAFDSALMSNTFLFLGVGYSDPDINLVLENQNFMYNSSHPHYFLSEIGLHGDLKQSLRKNRNLMVIDYDPIDDSYLGFSHAIVSLLALVEDRRIRMAAAQEW